MKILHDNICCLVKYFSAVETDKQIIKSHALRHNNARCVISSFKNSRSEYYAARTLYIPQTVHYHTGGAKEKERNEKFARLPSLRGRDVIQF